MAMGIDNQVFMGTQLIYVGFIYMITINNQVNKQIEVQICLKLHGHPLILQIYSMCSFYY